ncbi:MAG: P-II family nitrogen regulator [Oscillospiraceae bacterium]|nr:P-II family nitrogen regulator [Oscillospiraceae bacterium]
MILNYVVTIVDRDRGKQLTGIYSALGLKLAMSMLGGGTATAEHLAMYGLAETQKVIVAAVADADATKELIKRTKKQMSIDIPGNGILMAIPLKSVGGGRTLAYLTDNKATGGAPEMKFNHELIIVILNEGYSDMVMSAARPAGAGGGTVLHAKGTGARQGEKFLSVSLADEKDIIYIVATGSTKADIMRAINEKAGPDTKAGAICFSLPISAVAGLRVLDEE